MQLLHIDSRVLGGNSASRVLSAEIVARQAALYPGLKVSHRDLAADAGFGAEAKEAAKLKAREHIAAIAA